jgi:hypothetical protein
MLPKSHDKGLSLFFILTGVIIFALSFTVKTRTVLTIGPGFMPRVIGFIILALGTTLLLQTYARKDDEADLPGSGKTTKPFELTREAKIVLGCTILLLVLYVGLIETLGFPLTTAVYLAVQLFLLSEKRTVKKLMLYTVSAILSSIVITLLFTKVLGLYLPLGFFM